MDNERWTPLEKLRDGIRANRGQINLLHLVDMNERDHRAALVRVVTGQQWAMAIALHGSHLADPHDADEEWEHAIEHAEASLAEIPCAADAIADLLGSP